MFCTTCGKKVSMLVPNAEGFQVCVDCKNPHKHEEYNIKGFLLPESFLSMASYHAKVSKDGIYKLSLHDCNSGIRLWGDLNDQRQISEAIEKLKNLENAARSLRMHIENNYTVTPFP